MRTVNPVDVWYDANLNQDIQFDKNIKIYFDWITHTSTTSAPTAPSPTASPSPPSLASPTRPGGGAARRRGRLQSSTGCLPTCAGSSPKDHGRLSHAGGGPDP